MLSQIIPQVSYCLFLRLCTWWVCFCLLVIIVIFAPIIPYISSCLVPNTCARWPIKSVVKYWKGKWKLKLVFMTMRTRRFILCPWHLSLDFSLALICTAMGNPTCCEGCGQNVHNARPSKCCCSCRNTACMSRSTTCSLQSCSVFIYFSHWFHWAQWSYGVTVSTLDSESSDRGSNPRRTYDDTSNLNNNGHGRFVNEYQTL